jgi:S-adenosylmethionine decarboxylase
MQKGMHLLIDGFGCQKNLDNIEVIYHFLYSLPEKIGMTMMTPPIVCRFNSPIENKYGYTGMVVIAESHISIHTYPEDNYVAIDVFSCREFDHALTSIICADAFCINNPVCNVIERGLTLKV